MGKERHSARIAGVPVSACITDSSTTAKSVEDLPFVPTEKTSSTVQTVEGHRCASIRDKGQNARSVADPRYAPMKKGKIRAKNVHASMKREGGTVRSALPRRSAGRPLPIRSAGRPLTRP